MPKVRWGVLGVAKIATEKVIPAMQRGRYSEVTAIASRSAEKARGAAAALGIPKAYGSYDELLTDPDVDAIYNPLPNDLHVPWTAKAAERGKHVLCEKPIALTADEARQLIAARDRTGAKIQEAFMVRTHPQWLKVRALVQEGRIGELRSILGVFSYFNRDAANIRNLPSAGGGALMDIGCYLINTSRFLFGREPARAIGLVDRDPDMKIDRMTTIMLDFGTGHSAGTCSTQMVFYQQMQILGTTGRIELPIPFNAPPDRPCRVIVDTGKDLFGGGVSAIEIDTCNQYTIQGDLFSKAILDGKDVPSPIEDAVKNMACIDAVFRSAGSGQWEVPQ
ncbi:MAG TPA: Gfo/Idh/MocA family oxidoreductase [Vicinamibacterales bacterium]|jgi:predicted dehydrogenase